MLELNCSVLSVLFFVSVLVLVLGFVCYFFFFLMVYCVMILDFFKGCDSVCWCV